MGLPESLAKSLRTTNLIESRHSLIARFSGRVKNWKTPEMVMRGHSAACLDAEQRMNRIAGHKELDQLRNALRPQTVKARKSAEPSSYTPAAIREI